jgi:hypothetical protein
VSGLAYKEMLHALEAAQLRDVPGWFSRIKDEHERRAKEASAGTVTATDDDDPAARDGFKVKARGGKRDGGGDDDDGGGGGGDEGGAEHGSTGQRKGHKKTADRKEKVEIPPLRPFEESEPHVAFRLSSKREPGPTGWVWRSDPLISENEYEELWEKCNGEDKEGGFPRDHPLLRGLRRGIALFVEDVAHPSYYREVQRLASLGKIQMVFSDRSLAFGVNMPFRSCLFYRDTARPEEMDALLVQQMSGRAGRRGLDNQVRRRRHKGRVIWMDGSSIQDTQGGGLEAVLRQGD